MREENGLIFIAETRVTIDCVVEMFDHGASPEEIADQYDALALADVYAALAYFLRNEDAIRAYLARQMEESEEARNAADAAFPGHLREKLLRAQRDRRERGG